MMCDFMNEDEDNVSFNVIRCYMLRNLNCINRHFEQTISSSLSKESNVLHFASDKRKFLNTNQPCLQH